MKALLGHRRTPSTEVILKGGSSDVTCATPEKSTQLATTVEEHEMESVVSGEQLSSPSMGLTHGDGNAHCRSPQTGMTTTATEAGRLAAKQRERAHNPKGALGALISAPVIITTPVKKVMAMPTEGSGSETKARWSFGWGGIKASPSRPPSTRSCDDSAREGSVLKGEEEGYNSKADDSLEVNHVRRGGQIKGDTSVNESVEAGHVRRGGWMEVDISCEESADAAAQAAVLSAIEQNQLEQEALRKALHAKQSELTALLAQHTTLLRRQMEREQPDQGCVDAAPPANLVHAA